jgi:cell division septum initiation protein DivIVA
VSDLKELINSIRNERVGIFEKKFNVVQKGYDPLEVDTQIDQIIEFLRDIATKSNELIKDNSHLASIVNKQGMDIIKLQKENEAMKEKYNLNKK